MMDTKTIIRMEKAIEGHGMWYDSDGILVPEDYDKFKMAPMPFSEAHRKDNKEWFTGTVSLEQFTSWFNSQDIHELVDNRGFAIYRLESTEYQIEDTQILYTLGGLSRKEEITEAIRNKLA